MKLAAQSNDLSFKLFNASRTLRRISLLGQVGVAVGIAAIALIPVEAFKWVAICSAGLSILSLLPSLSATWERAFGQLPMSGWHFQMEVLCESMVLRLDKGEDTFTVWGDFLKRRAEMGDQFPQG